MVTQVWLNSDRAKGGYTKKLAHMWHGQFRAADLCVDHAVKLVWIIVEKNAGQLETRNRKKCEANLSVGPRSKMAVGMMDGFN